MVTRDEMARMSLRHDTQVAAAFRRALGVAGGAAPKAGRRRRRRRKGRGPTRAEVRECMRDTRSPMDRARWGRG